MAPRDRPVRLREDEDRDFLPAVREYAALCGWLTYHPLRSQGSPAGFPDLVCVRRGRLVFAELKAERGSLSREQRHWLAELRAVPGIEVYLWRPADRHELERILR